MHEYALVRQMIRIAGDAARSRGAKRVTGVRLVIGENSGVLADSVQMYFDMTAAGTPAEGAKLSIRFVKPQMWCARCGKNFIKPRFSFVCPDCGSLGSPTEIGNEFYVESVELETD